MKSHIRKQLAKVKLKFVQWSKLVGSKLNENK